MKQLLIVGGCILVLGCTASNPNKEWQYAKTITLDGINPIGLAATDEGLWMSDGDHNRVALIDERGGVVKEIGDLDRPMHITSKESSLFIPQYGNDKIVEWANGALSEMVIKDSLDAPAGVAVYDKEMAIADFYNHRILYFDGDNWSSIGQEGKEEGDFYYPTDVQITEDKIWVADAYNNRGQVFDKSGGFLFAFGKDQKMNAATGIFVGDAQVFLTDFENDRVLIFQEDGSFVQAIDRAIEKPTDILVADKKLHITNYRSGEVVIYD